MTTRNATRDEPELDPRDQREGCDPDPIPKEPKRIRLRKFSLGPTQFDARAVEGADPTRYQQARADCDRAGNKPDAPVTVRQDTLAALLDLAPLYAYPLLLTEKRPLEVPGPYAEERLSFLNTTPEAVVIEGEGEGEGEALGAREGDDQKVDDLGESEGRHRDRLR